MAKDTYYFPHDSNAYRDPKCAALRNDFGMEGYGLYWAIIEILHEQRDGKLEKFQKLFEGLAFQLQITKEALTKQMEAMIKDYKLLQENETHIWSNRVLRNLEERRIKYLIKAEAGHIGGVRSGEVRRMKQNEALLKANEQKESKGNKIKEKESIYTPLTIHPTIEEVKTYCQERKNSVDPHKWHNYYTSNGWKVGKNPMKDWRAAVRTWETKDKKGIIYV